jgi:hypothetical protein
VKEAAKKARERTYLERFRQNFVAFPEGEVVPSERPDFLIEAQPRRIGIEVIEYHVQEPDEDRGSETRAQEAKEDKVLRLASEQHRSRGLPPVVVSVVWHPHRALDSRRRTELVTDLAKLVQEHLPESSHSITIRRRHHPAWRSLPEEVASLTVVLRESISKNSWTSVRAGFVPTLTPPDLQKVLWDKEVKVSSYRRQCEEVWLLIVARGFEPSTFGDLGLEVGVCRFESDFDRVFFLHYFDGAVTELRTRKVV